MDEGSGAFGIEVLIPYRPRVIQRLRSNTYPATKNPQFLYYILNEFINLSRCMRIQARKNSRTC